MTDDEVNERLAKVSRSENLLHSRIWSRAHYIAVVIMRLKSDGTSNWASVADISTELVKAGLGPCNANGSHLFGSNSGIGTKLDIKINYVGGRKVAVRALGWKTKPDFAKIPLPAHIIAHYQGERCAHCGSSRNPEADHKVGREPFPATYTLDDAQTLCRSHNAMKREHCKKCELSNQRFDARDIGYAAGWLIGNEQWVNSQGRHGCKGCYWYDPNTFKYLISQNFITMD